MPSPFLFLPTDTRSGLTFWEPFSTIDGFSCTKGRPMTLF